MKLWTLVNARLAQGVRIAGVGLLTALTAEGARAGQTWIVDDDGPADATDLEAVQELASDGDVVLVMPGSYPSFSLSKSLTVLGPAYGPRPEFESGHPSGPVFNAPGGFTVAGLSLGRVQVIGVLGTALFEDCRFHDGTPDVDAVRVVSCSNVVFSRCDGKPGTIPPSKHDAGLRAESSRLLSLSCQWRGQSGWYSYNCESGRTGVYLASSSAWIIDSDVKGGDGTDCPPWSMGAGGGHGIAALGSTLDWRGVNDSFKGGDGGGSSSDATDAFMSTSFAVFGGVAPYSTTPYLSTIVNLPTAEPLLRLRGPDGPGATKELQLFAPLGAAAIVFVSVAHTPFSLPLLEGEVWLDPSKASFATGMAGAGQTQPASIFFPVLPAEVLGAPVLWIQAVLPTVPGVQDPSKWTVTNPVPFVPRF
jgi:hypothetical protein